MTRAGLPVPPGFVVSVDGWDRFVRESGLDSRIIERLSAINADDTRALKAAQDDIQQWIEQTDIPEDVISTVLQAYAGLSQQQEIEAEFVAVRSSGTVEDAADTSFAGM